MSSRKLFSKTTKQRALSFFKNGMPCSLVARDLDIPFKTVKAWYGQYLNDEDGWARDDDPELLLRKAAFRLFEKGYGYKRTAAEQKQKNSRIRHWLRLYKIGRHAFFTEGEQNFKSYPSERVKNILDRYAASTQTKKQFCFEEGISVGSLNNWLRQVGKFQ